MRRKRDDSVIKLDFSDDFMLDSVESRIESGNLYGALTLLNKRNEMYPPSADAFALAADIYEGMGIYKLAADAWYRFLDTCNEADFSEGYEGLAVSFMNMGDEFNSALYYHRFCNEEGAKDEEIEAIFSEEPQSYPRLRVVHSAEGDAPEILAEGLALLRAGELEKAIGVFSNVSERSDDYANAKGLSAMCTLMLGKEEDALKECEELLKVHPDNLQALTTYCAILGAQDRKKEAQEVAKKLAALNVTAVDDLYRVATALCETGLDEEAYEKLNRLKEKLPDDDNVLYFLAVSAYRTGRLAEAISALDTLTTLYPRKAVAKYYLTRMREQRDGRANAFSMSYFYRMPEDEYNTVAAFLLAAEKADFPEEQRGLKSSDVSEIFRLAFDEMEGRDTKLQLLAAKVAAKLKQDGVLREVLLDYEGDDMVKMHLLHYLVERNEDDSFGTVICNLYKEFFVHKIDIGERKAAEFMQAFADVYSKFALLSEAHERKICMAAEDIYAEIEEYEAWEYIDERQSLAAAIYREARLDRGERSFDDIVKLFGANKYKTQKILNLMI